MSRAQQNSTGRLRRASLALGLAALLAATACSAGQITQTDSQLPAVNGANVDVGAIAIRNARFAYPHEGHYTAGGEAVLIGSVINTGTEADTLTEVTSPVASEVELVGNTALAGGVTLSVGTPGEEFHAETAAPTTTTTTAAPTSAAEGEEGETAPTTTPAPTTTTATVVLGELRIVLTGLTEDLYPGKVYPVTFAFARAGTVTVELPIAAPSEPRVAEEHGESGEH